jgi:hypothetical protein
MNKNKRVICKHWEEKKCKFMNNPKICSFSHGEDDIIKNECFNGVYCWNEECNYYHPKDWNPYINKKECLICKKEYCNKENKKYNHIKDTNINYIKEDNGNIISYVSKNEDFPEIIKNKNNNKIIYERKYSDILKSKIKDSKEDIKYYKKVQETNPDLNKTYKINEIKSENKDILITIKKELYNEYKYLSKLDSTEWANYDEIEDIKDKIKNLEHEYKKIKNTYNKDDIFDDNINLDIIFNENIRDNFLEENEETPTTTINLIINGIEINDNIILDNISKNINKELNNNINKLIEKMEKEFKIVSEEVKDNINEIIKNKHLKFILINNLNEISSMIKLFKNNYYDVKGLINKFD